jgi:hypothetical protein
VSNRIVGDRREPIQLTAPIGKPSENGIHDSGALPSADAPCLAHCFVDGGMLRDRAHIQELVGAQAEKMQEWEREGVRAFVEMEPQEEVDSPSEPDGPKDELMHPSPVPRFKGGSGPLPCQIEASASLNISEEEKCSVPRSLGLSGQASIPRAGELGTAISRAGIRPAK